jgi:hypothetical protein
MTETRTLWHAKADHRFRLYDRDGNGRLQEADLLRPVGKVGWLLDLHDEGSRMVALRVAQTHLWMLLARSARSTSQEGDGTVNAAVFAQVIRETPYSGSPFDLSTMAFFDVVDTSGRGFITPAEHGMWMWACGMTDMADSGSAFAMLDWEQEGRLSRDTVRIIGHLFHKSGEPDRGLHLYGTPDMKGVSDGGQESPVHPR